MANTTPVNPLLHPLAGVYAAAVTPLQADGALALDDLPILLEFLASRGCHGALLFGTTGEGPSFSPAERLTLLQEALNWRADHANFHILMGTGTPSLEETSALTRACFELGADGVVVLPPYYYKNVADDGLFTWFSQVIRQAVPPDGAFLGYHIPKTSGVPLSLNLLARLKDAFPDRFAGIKDSTGDAEAILALEQRFGPDLFVVVGADQVFSHALSHAGSGCITALANLFSPDLRLIWDAHLAGKPAAALAPQQRLNNARAVTSRYQPAPPVLKALLARHHSLPLWQVLPPMEAISGELAEQISQELNKA